MTERRRQVIVSLCEAVTTVSTTERRKVCDGRDASQFTPALGDEPPRGIQFDPSARRALQPSASHASCLKSCRERPHLYELGHIRGKPRRMRQKRTPCETHLLLLGGECERLKCVSLLFFAWCFLLRLVQLKFHSSD